MNTCSEHMSMHVGYITIYIAAEMFVSKKFDQSIKKTTAKCHIIVNDEVTEVEVHKIT